MKLDLDCLKLRATWGMVKRLCGILGICVIYIKYQTIFQTWAANRNPHGHTPNRTVLICSRVTSHTDNFVAIYLQLVKDLLNNIRIQKLVFTFCFRHLIKQSNTLFHTNLNVFLWHLSPSDIPYSTPTPQHTNTVPLPPPLSMCLKKLFPLSHEL